MESCLLDGDAAVDLAYRLVGRDAFKVGWGGRTRVVSAARSWRSRAASVTAVPAYLPRARAWRAVAAARTALAPQSHRRERTAATYWLPDVVAELVPRDALVGTPGPHQSVLLRLADPTSDRVVAIAKVAVSTAASARSRVRNEVDAMRDPVVRNVVPEVLAEAQVNGHAFFIMRHANGRPLGAGVGDFRRAHRLLDCLGVGCRRVSAARHPWLQLVATKFARVPFDRLPREVAVVRTHGDYAPWNVLRSRDGRFTVIDWEASVAEGVPGVDTAYYSLAVERYLCKRAANAAAERAVRSMMAVASVTASEASAYVALGAAGALLQDPLCGQGNNGDRYWRNVIEAASR